MATGQGRQRTSYIEGSAARQLDVRRPYQEEIRQNPDSVSRRRVKTAPRMNFGYAIFLLCAMLLAGYVLIGYIQLQADLTSQIQQISTLERQLNDLRHTNDDELTRINSSLDLEEIKRVAIYELGMVYATEGQIIRYTNESSDYVIQLSDIPNQ